MRKELFTLTLDDEHYDLIVTSMIEMKNKLTREGWLNPRMDKSELLKNTAENVYTIYNPANIPFDDNSDSFDAYAWYGFDDEQNNIEKIRFQFKDKDVVYNIKDIIEEAGLLANIDPGLSKRSKRRISLHNV